ncbi:hypothetical protein QTP88_011387 [Uroleucon formosanum]
MRSLHAAVPVGGGGEVRAFWPRLKRDPPLFAADAGKNGEVRQKIYEKNRHPRCRHDKNYVCTLYDVQYIIHETPEKRMEMGEKKKHASRRHCCTVAAADTRILLLYISMSGVRDAVVRNVYRPLMVPQGPRIHLRCPRGPVDKMRPIVNAEVRRLNGRLANIKLGTLRKQEKSTPYQQQAYYNYCRASSIRAGTANNDCRQSEILSCALFYSVYRWHRKLFSFQFPKQLWSVKDCKGFLASNHINGRNPLNATAYKSHAAAV